MGFNTNSREPDAYARQLIHHKARQLVGNYGFSRDDQPDIEGELTADLLARLPKFDGSRAALNTFVSRVVNHQVARMIQERLAAMRDYRRCRPSLNEPVTPDVPEGKELIESLDQDTYLRMTGRQSMPVADQAARRVDLARALGKLSAPQRALCARLASGQPVADIARELGLHRSTIYTQIEEIRTVFRQAGLEQYL